MIGATVSHYKILEKLGEGGMGVVFKAEDTRLGRTVALKFLSQSASDETARQRFVREARTASSLDHPNICSIHEIDETNDGRLFIVMPCYEGETLKARIERGPMRAKEALSIIIQVISGLSRAHDKGIIHRDIKPANIFITKDGLVKVVDFGLAKLAGKSRLTRTGATPGTILYMSPEQVRDGRADQRSDIWAVGTVLYEMITGQPPFKGEYDQAVIYSIMNVDPEPVRKLRPDVPLEVERLISGMIEKDPNKRCQSSAGLIPELQALMRKFETSEAGPELDDSKPVPSIAVLPFANMSPDPENQYFGDGLAEELINAFAQIEGLRVASRTSSFRFRGEGVDIQEVGEALHVGTLLEGSVRKAGNRLRITAQLINIADGYHIWSKRFDREMEDIFDIQDEIARSIVDQLKVKLIGGEEEKLMRFGTENLEAYTALLEGRYHLHSLTPEGWAKGFEMLNRSIELDPNFALPHSWLSMFYQSLGWWGTSPPQEVMPKSMAAARRAAELDDNLGFAHINKGIVHFCYEWDFEAAEKEFQRGLELDPTSGYGHMAPALFYSCRGRKDEALVEAGLALKLEPLDGLIAAWVAAAMMGAGAADEAIDTSLRALALGQEHWQLRMFLGSCYLHTGRIKDALPEYERGAELSGEASIALADLGLCRYMAGDRLEGEQIFERLTERSKKEYVAPSLFAYLEIARGRGWAAKPHLERAIRARDLFLVTDNMWPKQVRLRGSEFAPILENAGL